MESSGVQSIPAKFSSDKNPYGLHMDCPVHWSPYGIRGGQTRPRKVLDNCVMRVPKVRTEWFA